MPVSTTSSSNVHGQQGTPSASKNALLFRRSQQTKITNIDLTKTKYQFLGKRTETLVLTTRNGHQIHLDANDLKKWIRLVEPAKNWGLYGFKSPEDIILFLKSPAGQTVKKLIGEQLLVEMAREKYQRQQEIDKRTKKFRKIAALLLALSYKRKALAKQRELAFFQQIHKNLENKLAQQAQTLTSVSNPYQIPLEAIKMELEAKSEELKKVTLNIDRLKHHKEMLTKRHQLLETHVAQARDFISEAMDASLDVEKINHALEQQISRLQAAINKPDQQQLHIRLAALISKHKTLKNTPSAVNHSEEIKAVEKQIWKLEEKIRERETQREKLSLKQNKLNEHKESGKTTLDANDRITYIENQMEQLEEEIDSQLAQFDRLFHQHRDDEAMELTTVIQGLFAKVASWQEFIDFYAGRKRMCNEKGEETQFIADAHFFLTPKQKIVLYNGKYYLLASNQEFASLNNEEMAKAELNYKNAKPNIASIKNLLQSNKGIETTLQQQKLDKAEADKTKLANEIKLLKNQQTDLQADAARIGASQGNQATASERGTRNLTPLRPTVRPSSSLAGAKSGKTNTSNRLLPTSPRGQGRGKAPSSVSSQPLASTNSLRPHSSSKNDSQQNSVGQSLSAPSTPYTRSHPAIQQHQQKQILSGELKSREQGLKKIQQEHNEELKKNQQKHGEELERTQQELATQQQEQPNKEESPGPQTHTPLSTTLHLGKN